MAINRNLSAALKRDLFTPFRDDDLRVLLTIDHDSFADPFRFVTGDPNEFTTLTSNGEDFTAFPFEISILPDGESQPRSSISIQNVDDRIGTTLLELPTEAVNVTLQVVLRSTPDVIEYEVVNMELVNINITAVTVTGDIVVRGQDVEPCPGRVLSSFISPVFFR